MNSNTVNQIIQSGLLLAVLGVLVAGLKFAKVYLEAKTTELQTKIGNQAVNDVIDTVEDSIWTVVMQLAQETVDDLKAKASDGKLTAKEIEMLRQTAKNRAIKLMGQETYDVFKDLVADADAWMLSKIDAYSRQAKIVEPVNNITVQ
jgi:hypothetical protein